MNETTETKATDTTTPDPDAATAALLESYRQEPARIVKALPRETEGQKSARERALAGEYRVIHGNIAIAVPLEKRLLPNGNENPHLPKQVMAQPGDIVWLGDEDAARMLDQDIVEPLNSHPSRVGKVCQVTEFEKAKRPWDFAAAEQHRIMKGQASART